MKRRNRAYAYITHGNRLLVFEHADVPEAGIQVPAGTVEEHETPQAAVIREAREETGLKDLEFVTELGNFEHDMTGFGVEELQHAWFYHLRCTEEPPESWRHHETHEGTGEPILFELYWVSMPDGVPELIGLNGGMIEGLYESIGVVA